MHSLTNQQHILTSRPDGSFPESLHCFSLREAAVPNSLPEKSVLVEVEMLSIDAAMRVWMNGVFTYMEGV